MIEYNDCIVTFIDILGFRKLVDHCSAEEVSNCIERFRAFAELSKYRHKSDDPDEDNYNSYAVSDCIIRFTRILDGVPPVDFAIAELEVLAYAQLNYLCRFQMVIRGGVAFGKAYIKPSKQIFYGTAYNAAYEMESIKGAPPRIAVDKSIENLIEAPFDYLYTENGIKQLDYLRSALVNEAFTEQYFQEHKDAIVYLMRQSQSGKDSIKQKYVWLANYHNSRTVRFGLANSFLIPKDEIDALGTP